MSSDRSPFVVEKYRACHTCGSSFEVCPDCGARLIHRPIQTKLYCKLCNTELVKVGEGHDRAENSMGQECQVTWNNFACPNHPSVQWNPNDYWPPSRVFVKEFSDSTWFKENLGGGPKLQESAGP